MHSVSTMNKSSQLQDKINQRSKNPSTAEKYGFKEIIQISDDTVNQLTKLPVCKECYGTKTVSTLFAKRDCDKCFATGLDLSDALAVVRLQQSYLATAKSVITSQRHAIFNLTHTEEEKLGASMDKFYQNAKRFD